MATSTNPQSRAYPKAGANTTRAKVVSNLGATVEAKPGLKNVNVSRGPTTGNMGMPDKRRAFMDKKSESGTLADSINAAYAARTMPPKTNPALEGVEMTVAPRKRSR
jgi:hypothetical protein